MFHSLPSKEHYVTIMYRFNHFLRHVLKEIHRLRWHLCSSLKDLCRRTHPSCFPAVSILTYCPYPLEKNPSLFQIQEKRKLK